MMWPHQQFALEQFDVDPEAVRILLGIDPARTGEAEPVFAAEVRGLMLPRPVAPRKRRGLTGRRYRIARRRYAREMRAWRRGEGTRVPVRYFIPHARPTLVPSPRGVRGQRVRFTILNEAEALSPQDAKPGYSEVP